MIKHGEALLSSPCPLDPRGKVLEPCPVSLISSVAALQTEARFYTAPILNLHQAIPEHTAALVWDPSMVRGEERGEQERSGGEQGAGPWVSP